MTTTEQLQHLRELLAKATPAPWKAASNEELGENWAIALSTGQTDDNKHWHVCTDRVRASQMITGDAKTDCETIAALRNLAPSLLDELDRLRQVEEAARHVDTAFTFRLGAIRASGASTEVLRRDALLRLHAALSNEKDAT